MKKRRQHYVWKKYLDPWTEEGKVWCHRKGERPFHTSPLNVAVERDFYKLHSLTQGDMQFIFKLAIEPIKNDLLRKLNAEWITLFERVFRFSGLIREQEPVKQEVIDELDEILHNLDENYHDQLENVAATCLDRLICGDGSFYNNDDCASTFTYFLSSQYFRTKNIQDSFFRSFSNINLNGTNMERVWPILRHIFATSMGFTLFEKRDIYRLIIHKNDSTLNFITCDQPVLNVHAAGRLGEGLMTNVELYYPVSPRTSVLISNDSRYAGKHEVSLGIVGVSNYNNIVEKSAYEQIFTKTEQCLPIGTPFSTGRQ